MKSRTLSVFGLIVTVLVVPGNAGALPAAPQTAAQATVTPQNLRAERADDPAAAPARREGDGPFTRLIIRGATLIDGTGGPPRGPVDIVIEGNKIVDIAGAGTPGLPMNDSTRRPRGAVREIQAAGMYVIPGLVDLHVHQGTKQKAPDSEYYNKLWLAHGITAVRGVPFASFDYSMKEKARSAKTRSPRHGTSSTSAPAAVGRRVRCALRSRHANGCVGSPKMAAMDSRLVQSAPTSWPRCSMKRRSSGSDRLPTCSRPASRR